MPEHEYVDLKIPKTNDDDWYVSLYGKNLNDDTLLNLGSSECFQGGAQFATYTDPLTWGVMFGTKF